MDDKDKREKKSLYQILDKQGFYVILLLCLAIVGAAVLWANNEKEDHYISENPTNPFEEKTSPEITLVEEDSGEDDAQHTGRIGEGRPKEDQVKDSLQEKERKEEREKEKEKEREKQEQKDKQDQKERQENKNRQEDQDKKQDAEKKEEKDITKANTTGDENQKNDIKEKNAKEKEAADLGEGRQVAVSETMAMPVMGRLALPFADDRLIYHATLDQWSTHKGVDIKAAEGAPVKAALDGEVVEVSRDPAMGISIIIKHNDELLTVYSNLSTDAMVKVGEEVKKGQTISGVGKTASAKALQSPLLHFQVFAQDKFVDPELYLGKISR